MSKIIFLFAFVPLIFSLSKCAKQQAVDPKTKEMQMKQESGMETERPDGQDNKSNMVDLMVVMAMCNESFRIEMSYLQALNESGSFPDETDKTPKCYVRCVMEGTRIASEKGEYDPAQAAAVFGAGDKQMEFEKIAIDCASRDESCKCERAYQFMKCLMEKHIETSEKPQ